MAPLAQLTLASTVTRLLERCLDAERSASMRACAVPVDVAAAERAAAERALAAALAALARQPHAVGERSAVQRRRLALALQTVRCQLADLRAHRRRIAARLRRLVATHAGPPRAATAETVLVDMEAALPRLRALGRGAAREI